MLSLAAIVAVTTILARRIVFPQRSRPTAISAVGSGRIVLAATPIAKQQGTSGFLYDNETRHAALGPIIGGGEAGTVDRELRVEPGEPAPQSPSFGRPIGNPFRDAAAVSPAASEVQIDTELGAAPAWLFPGTEPAATTWAIHVHGMLTGRDAAFRSAHSLLPTGYTSLIPSMRGDGDGPASPRGVFMLGQTEWLDIDAAIQYAISHGAERILLVGWSSGANIALRLAASSVNRDHISGLVLVSPVISWRQSVHFSAAGAGLPRFLPAMAIWALERRSLSTVLGSSEPLRFSELEATDPRIPVLAIHSEGDRTTPFAETRRFAEENGEFVELAEFQPAGHALEWNADTERFESIVATWCRSRLAST
ncbi:alpha/beta hydrolase family protein [Rathayibacter rathayi]|uniref:alpha/beta hydrolase family protein n=1 Tax=Rathayibacter rathayi TaxID=33887 RepID=UPI0015E32C3E|nr:alpha/beta fold hydrolase [Rathayibacter rathayi]